MTRARPRLAVIATHPIQYYAPLFRLLAERGAVDVRVFYEWEGSALAPTLDHHFGQAIQWDIPLLDGYPHEFVPNRSSDPGTHHLRGLDNPQLVPRILAYRPDAVLIFGWNYVSHLRALRALHRRVPILFRGDSTLLGEQPGLRRAARRVWLRWVYRHIDIALYVGQHNRAYFQAHGVTGDRLAWAPHAVDHARFEDPNGEHEAAARQWRANLGIPPDAPTFVFAGKLEPNKEPALLLDAFLSAEAEDAHLILVGSGPLERMLRDRAKESTSGARVHFIGFQNQSRMPVVYRLGDVLVLPSQSETWGLAVNEAMASGRAALVSSRVGCAPDLVMDGETGVVVPSGDSLALREALQHLTTHPDLVQTMSCQADRHIQAWSLEALAAHVEAATHKVASR